MLIHMMPEQVSNQWSFFAPTIGSSLPPTVEHNQEGMTNILYSVLKEDLDVWIYTEDDQAMFVLTTCVRQDPITKQKDLLIYSLTGIREMNEKGWNDAYKTLSKFARSRDCKGIIAYTADPKISNYIKSRGGEADFTLIQMEV